MKTLQITPVMAQRRSLNFGENAEDATLVMEEQPAREKRPLFIEANTIEASLEHLRNDCIIPVFAKDNEATLSHVAFIETVQDAARTFFQGEQIELPRHSCFSCDWAEYQKQSISLPINYWKVTRLSTTKDALLSFKFLRFTRQ